MRKIPRLIVRDRDAALAALAELRPATLVADVQPFAAPWGCSPGAAISGMLALSEYLATAVPDLKRLVFVTNAHLGHSGRELRGEPLEVTFVSAARKPWRTAYLAGTPRPLAVLGDQIMTDGLLAFRLHGSFLHWRAGGHIPWWPRVQAMCGSLFAWLMFSPVRDRAVTPGRAGSAR